MLPQVGLGEKLPFKNYRYDRNLAAERSDSPGQTSEIPSATATVKPPSTRLEDVFISVKTTKHYHAHRLPVILKTWFQLAKSQVSELRNFRLSRRKSWLWTATPASHKEVPNIYLLRFRISYSNRQLNELSLERMVMI